jgi:hypothetical protein
VPAHRCGRRVHGIGWLARRCRLLRFPLTPKVRI